jgi:amidase
VTLDLDTATLTEAAAAIAAGEVGSEELLDAQLDRIDIFNPSVNAVVAFDIERATAAARAADAARLAGEASGPLAGVPMTVKDTWETAGCVTTAGAPALADHVPAADADVITGLRDAGAVIYGKTNVPLYAGDHQTYNEVYGLTRNPWDPDRTAGGSSGGAAVSVACGFSLGEVGSDIGGSIRAPAHFNGLFGLKTSWGAISYRGHLPGPPGTVGSTDLTVAGPLGRSVADLELLLDASLRHGAMRLGGAEPVPGASLPPAGATDLERLRIGLWVDDDVAPVDHATIETIAAFARALEAAGAAVDDAVRPAIASADLHDIYGRLLNPVMSAGLPASVRVRLASIAAQAEGPLDAGDPTTFTARHARDSLSSHAAWLDASEHRARAQRAWADVFASVDVMLMPVSQTQAFPHDIERSYRDRTVVVDRGPEGATERAYHELLFWSGLATMPLLPSLAIPLGPVEGLPLGVQLVGPRWSDRRLLSIGTALVEAAGLGFTPPTLVAG